ncbi:MAG: hypothetical protein ACR2OM_16040 [Aestuariivirgaceae bacterium]
MLAPARHIAFTGAVLIAGSTMAGANDACNLSENTICQKLLPSLQLSCVKHVQLTVAACLRSKRQERFGSHEDHCRVGCRAGLLAVDLDKRLRHDALATAQQSGRDDRSWLAQARGFWRIVGTCSAGEVRQAQTACETSCRTDARRRDLEELQGLASGKDFLTLQQPEFGCLPSAASELLSRDKDSAIEWLYPPGHPRRAERAVE